MTLTIPHPPAYPQIRTTHVLMVCASVIIATISLRDILFMIVGMVLVGLGVLYYQAEQAFKLNKWSRIVVSFEDLKQDFTNVVEKVDMVYVNRNYFINNYSKDLYHHVTHEEQLNIIQWIEEVESNLKRKSLREFRDFEENSREVRVHEMPYIVKIGEDGLGDVLVVEERSVKENETMNFSINLNLRNSGDIVMRLNEVDLKTVDENCIMSALSDVRSVVLDFFKHVEDSDTTWSDLNNQAIDKLKLIFSSDSEINQRNYNWFGISQEHLSKEVLLLLGPGSHFHSYLKILNCQSLNLVDNIILLDWDGIRNKFIDIRDKLKEHAVKSTTEKVVFFYYRSTYKP